MPDTPEARARQKIDQLLTNAGWLVQSRDDANLTAGRGAAIREFPMKTGFGEADYLLYVDSEAVGVVEAKKEGSTLTGFEIQTAIRRQSTKKPVLTDRLFCFKNLPSESLFKVNQ